MLEDCSLANRPHHLSALDLTTFQMLPTGLLRCRSKYDDRGEGEGYSCKLCRAVRERLAMAMRDDRLVANFCNKFMCMCNRTADSRVFHNHATLYLPM